jgi:hypothetical protein
LFHFWTIISHMGFVVFLGVFNCLVWLWHDFILFSILFQALHHSVYFYRIFLFTTHLPLRALFLSAPN